MGGKSRQEVVSRAEFYGIVCVLFSSLFAVVFTGALELDRWVRMICNILLCLAFVGAAKWFGFLSKRERQRHKNLDGGEAGAEQGNIVDGSCRTHGRDSPGAGR